MCDTVVVVKRDRVLFAKNSGRDANEAQLLEWHRAAAHALGSSVRCTWVEIPQVARTNAIVISRPFWTWGAEIGSNEHGVTIGNQAVFTRQAYAATGLTGMDILRLALERAASAKHAVAVISDLVKRVGQGGGCGHEDPKFTYHNSFIVADTRAAYVVETAGRDVAVEVVTGARSISNALTIPKFARRHSDRLKSWGAGARARRECTEKWAGLAGGPADLSTILRQHRRGSVAPHYERLRGGLVAPCMHGGGIAVNSQTTASWVAELSPQGVRHWATGTSAPCTGVFKPVVAPLAGRLASAPVPSWGPAPTDQADADSLWWRHERLHRRLLRGGDSPTFASYREERDALESRWFRETLSRQGQADAFDEASEWLDGWNARLDEARVADERPGWTRRYWAERNRRAGLRI